MIDSSYSHHLIFLNLSIISGEKRHLISFAGTPPTIEYGSTSFTKLRSAKSAIVDSKDVFEGSNFIGKNAVVKDCQIGFASYVAYESHIEHCQIGKYCCIGPYVRTITGKHPIEFAAMHPFFYAKKNQIGESYVDITKYEEHDYIDNEKHYQVFIGNDVWIGNGAKIMAGVHIGDGAVVAADALIF